MTNISKAELAELIAQTVTTILAGQAPKATASAKPTNSLEAKDRALIAGFKRKGIPVAEIVLMDRNDKSKPYTIKPFKAWLEQGRQVRKGERGIRGLFHISQTDVIAPAKPAKGKSKPALVKAPTLPLA